MTTKPLQAMIPAAPEVSIVTTAVAMDGVNEDDWRQGVTFSDRSCLTISTWEHGCVDDEHPNKDMSDAQEQPVFMPFTIYVPWECTAVTAQMYREARADATESLRAKSAWMIARELQTGAKSGLNGGASLQTTARDVSNPDGALPARVAAQTLIANYQDCTNGGRAVLHVPSVLMDQLFDTGYTTRVGDRIVTPTGDLVIPGPGYANTAGEFGPYVDPEDPDAGFMEQDDDTAWMYVTGDVQIALSAPWEDESNDRSGVNPGPTFARMNKALIHAERDVLFRFAPCCVFACLARKSVTA